jgi:hypothetical protein
VISKLSHPTVSHPFGKLIAEFETLGAVVSTVVEIRVF